MLADETTSKAATPLRDCKYGNVVICFTNAGSGVEEGTGGWCHNMPSRPDIVDFIVDGICQGIRKDWISN